METFLTVVAIAIVLVGFAGILLPLLPGTPLVFGGLWMLAWVDNHVHVGGTTILVLAAMAMLAWLVDYIAAALGVRGAGASKSAVAGAGVGALIGIAFGMLGIVVGPIMGAAAGEWIARRNRWQAARAGIAAGIGFVLAVAIKIGIAFAMLGVFALAWLA